MGLVFGSPLLESVLYWVWDREYEDGLGREILIFLSVEYVWVIWVWDRLLSGTHTEGKK